MTRADLIDYMAEKHGLTKIKAGEIVVSMFERIQQEVAGGGEVSLGSGIGKFTLRETPAHKGRNPRTGEALDIAAKRSAKFTPGKQFVEGLAAA